MGTAELRAGGYEVGVDTPMPVASLITTDGDMFVVTLEAKCRVAGSLSWRLNDEFCS